jgi:hypothetical protein
VAPELRECVNVTVFARLGGASQLWGFVGILIHWQTFCPAVRRHQRERGAADGRLAAARYAIRYPTPGVIMRPAAR